MGITVVVGGQYGSEGKGKITAVLAMRARNPWVVRCGGPNSGHTVCVGEYTSVTNRVRRVGYFNMNLVKTACRYNRPTSLAVMGLDRLDHSNAGAVSAGALSETAKRFIQSLEQHTKVPVEWVGTESRTDDVIYLSD